MASASSPGDPSTPTGDIRGLLSGLRVHKISLHVDAPSSTTDARREGQLARIIEFSAWSDFDDKAKRAKAEAQGLYSERSCEGRYQRRTCGHDICGDMVAYKQATKEYSISNEARLVSHELYLLEVLRKIAIECNPGLNVEVKQEQHVSHHLQVRLDLSLVDPRTPTPPVVAIEVKLPKNEHPIITSSAGTASQTQAQRLSEEQVATRYNGVMQSGESTWLRKAICQTVFEALHTTSGWGCLYNHDTAVFFKVNSQRAATRRRWLRVSVSRIYECDDRSVTTIHGLLALFQGMKEANRTNKLLGFIGEIENMKNAEDNADLSERLEKVSIQEQNRERDARAERRSRAREAGPASQTSQASSCDCDHCSDCDQCSDCNQCSDWSRPTARLTDEEEQALDEAIRGEVFLNLRYSQMHRIFISRSLGQIGVGGNGYVLRARIRGAEVAIKMRHIGSESGAMELRREIEVYKSIAGNHGHMLGKTVPRLLAVCEDSDEEDVLVTEFVGSELHRSNARDEDGLPMWFVDDMLLTKEDKASIIASAGDGLKEIHACGLAHNDVRYPNLRVQRVGDVWRTWWIDLGRAAKPEYNTHQTAECKDCAELFR